LAEAVGADLGVMKRDALKMGGHVVPTIFSQVKHDVNVDAIVDEILFAYKKKSMFSLKWII